MYTGMDSKVLIVAFFCKKIYLLESVLALDLFLDSCCLFCKRKKKVSSHPEEEGMMTMSKELSEYVYGLPSVRVLSKGAFMELGR